MPFDVGDFAGASAGDRAASRRSRRMVGLWLLGVAGMILVMITLGGLTRLTGSGLSIMEWAPLMGALPPLSEAEWQRLFSLYRNIPQYILVNSAYELADFKKIFWLEWTHRAWGRAIGLAFVAPLIVFWARGHVSRTLLPRLMALLVLGGMQGVIGWFMVASGFFPDATVVSPYRLVVHLGLALLLYATILWTALDLLRPPPTVNAMALTRPRRWASLSLALVTLTMLAGGFVAGLRAGLIYNTFPLMDGRLIPDGYAALSPFLLNWTENVAATQFNHRLLASLTVMVTLIAAARAWRAGLSLMLVLSVAAVVLAQYGLGIATLLLAVPVDLGTSHQMGGVLTLTAVLVLRHHTRRGPGPTARSA